MELNEPQRYRIPAGRHQVVEEILRSRFITTVDHTPTVELARNMIASVSQEYKDASHHCWAYVVGPPGSTAQIGLSDAGEPHGTAGRPMLTVLLHSGIGDICAVITRYFGGTLLGKGGLVKAYSGGVQLALASLPTTEQIPTSALRVRFDYTHITLLKRLLPDYGAKVLDEQYGVDVTYMMEVPNERVDALTQAIMNLTGGQASTELA